MKFSELIKRYQKEATGLFINGYGLGRITKIEDDYVDFEIIRKESDKLMKETMHIQIPNMEISLGQKEVPKTQEQKEIENDLEAI